MRYCKLENNFDCSRLLTTQNYTNCSLGSYVDEAVKLISITLTNVLTELFN